MKRERSLIIREIVQDALYAFQDDAEGQLADGAHTNWGASQQENKNLISVEKYL